MELGIKDRLYIPQILSQKNNFAEYSLKKSIISKVAINKKDSEEYEIKETEGVVTWNSDKDSNTPLIVEFSKDEIAYIKKSCEALIDTAYPDDFWETVKKIYVS